MKLGEQRIRVRGGTERKRGSRARATAGLAECACISSELSSIAESRYHQVDRQSFEDGTSHGISQPLRVGRADLAGRSHDRRILDGPDRSDAISHPARRHGAQRRRFGHDVRHHAARLAEGCRRPLGFFAIPAVELRRARPGARIARAWGWGDALIAAASFVVLAAALLMLAMFYRNAVDDQRVPAAGRTGQQSVHPG